MKEYKVITLFEPFATLYAHGIKKIETRPKPTNWTIEKGSYLIHTAQEWTMEQENICTYNKCIRKELNEITDCIKIGHPYWKHHFHFGYIIGAIDVVECREIQIGEFTGKVHIYNSKNSGITVEQPELSFGDYREGRYAWISTNARLLKKPIPYKGGQGYYRNFKGNIDDLIFK